MSQNKTMGSEKHYPPESRRDRDYYPSSFDGNNWWGNSYSSNPLRGLDLDEEYLKIAEKKSTLPASTRRLIKKLKHNNAIAFILGIED